MRIFHSLASKITLFVTIIVLLTTGIIASIVFWYTSAAFQVYSENNVKNFANLLSNDIENAFVKVVKDLDVLSKTPPIQGIVRSSENAGRDDEGNSNIELWRNRLSVIFSAMLKVNENYTQIRYLGIKDDGKEIVRVNRIRDEVFRTQESALQSKGQSKYFPEGLKLSEGSIGFSEMDYNIEHNRVQMPKLPTWRVMMPVYSKQSQVFGLLIINLNIKQYIKEIINRKNVKYRLMLTTRLGDLFLYDPKEGKLSFYMYSEKIPGGYEGNPKLNTPKKAIAFFQSETKNLVIARNIYSSHEKHHKVLTLYVIVPKAELDKQDDMFVYYIISSVLLVGMLASILIYFYSKITMRNLSRMAKVIQDSAESRQIEIKALPTHLNDEVGVLARAFEKKTKLLSQMALFDSLTGLPNRKSFMDRLEEALVRAKRHDQMAAVFYFDLNNFKEVNDTYGHDYADEVLIEFGNVLKDCIRGSDYCARLSGDEFAVVSEDVNAEGGIEALKKRFMDRLNRTYTFHGVTLSLKMSGGVALYPKNGSKATELLHQADLAMYESKREGMGRIVRSKLAE